MAGPKILAMVLAGGEGTRLFPLTAERSKPAVPFGGRYRIVDFVLSNLINSEIHSIYVLVQYKSQSLIEHIHRAWVLSPIIPGQFVSIVPPQMGEGPEWFQGTADAVYQNLNLLDPHAPDLVAVFGADHVYRMDIRQMVRFHLEREAEVTVAALPVPIQEASAFGIVEANRSGRITGFVEKPVSPPPMPSDPERAFASMGNYLFNTQVLIEALHEARRLGEKDFGRDVIPRLIASHRVFAYDFSKNKVPGVRSYEEPAYWRDVGTIDAFYAAHRDTLGTEPRFNLFNPRWPILSSGYQGPVAAIVRGTLENCDVGAGSLIKDATVRNSVLRREVLLEEDVVVEDSIVMDYTIVRAGARLKRVIVDRYNVLGPGERIGYNLDEDKKRFHVTGSGIVVIPKGAHRADTRRYY